MSCRDGSCENVSVLKRTAAITLEQRIEADLFLKDYVEQLRREGRGDLAERVIKEEGLRKEIDKNVHE